MDDVCVCLCFELRNLTASLIVVGPLRRELKQGGEAVDLALARCEHVRDGVEKRQRTEWHAPGWAAAWTATWAASNIAGTHPMTLYGSEV